MSVQNAKAMMQILQNDESLRDQIAASTSQDAALNLAVSLGNSQGLDFTVDEVLSELQAAGLSLGDDGQLQPLSGIISEEGELDETALEAVAGGFYYGNSRGSSCSQW